MPAWYNNTRYINMEQAQTAQIQTPADWPDFGFHVTHSSAENGVSGRCGRLHLPHATVETPVFMPVGTQATVKAMTPGELREIGFGLILGNTYHLHLRPGEELIARSGGLGRFQGWDGALLTDSGGFQVFSLAGLRRIGEDGVQFQSHLDGSKHVFTSESVMQIERDLGADIIMAFDECAPYPSTPEYARQAMDRTHRWAERCMTAYNASGRRATGGWGQALFGIVQGGVYPDLRTESANTLVGMDFPGYAVGGLAVGEPCAQRNDTIAHTTPLLPHDKPRYLMGVGTPPDLLEAVERGIDMFDCVLPTRNARNAQVFTSRGVLNLRNAKYAEDWTPIDAECQCQVCRTHTRAYIRHLFNAKEILGPRLTTYHNLAFYHRLMADIRQHLKQGTYKTFKTSFLEKYNQNAQTNASDAGTSEAINESDNVRRD